MQISEVALAAAITVSIAGVSYLAFAPERLTEDARAVADKATCRTLTSAVAGYVAQHGADPRSITDLRPFVDGDVSRYTLLKGRVAGPGCA